MSRKTDLLGSAHSPDPGHGPMHGWAIAQRIQQVTKDVQQIAHGSLYPALHRLEQKDWPDITSG